MVLKFYRCHICGNIVTPVKSHGVAFTCCGTEMEVIPLGMVDAAEEKHVPFVKIDGNIVRVNIGSVDHPMNENHYIEWIAIETKNGQQVKALNPDSAPHVDFALTDDDEFVAAYAYCNLHGLWKSK